MDPDILIERLLTAKGNGDAKDESFSMTKIPSRIWNFLLKSTVDTETGCWLIMPANAESGPSPSCSKSCSWLVQHGAGKLSDKWGIFSGDSDICLVALARLFSLFYAIMVWKSFFVGLKARPKVESWPFIQIGSRIPSPNLLRPLPGPYCFFIKYRLIISSVCESFD